jgi:D-3-phosphoglycerate dehydrogenase
MKVLITESIADVAIGILQQYAEVDINLGSTPEQLRSIIGQYEALIVRSETKVTSDIIEAAGNLRVIGRVGVGVDNINVEAATHCGIIVVNSPEGNIVSTAEYTIAMLSAIVRHIPEADGQLHAGVWNRKLKGFEVRNKTMGIIGLGRVGTEVAQMAKGLRMNVIASDPMVTEERAERLGIRLVEIGAVLQEADFITIHVPLNPTTKGLIGREQLKLMKPTAMLVNCARGGIIDEAALYEALEQGLLAGAAIDVFAEEPIQDNVLLKSHKVIVTPHLAASTAEAEISASRDVAEQVIAVLQGYPARSPINAPMISAEDMAVLGPYLKAGRTIGQIGMQIALGQLKSLIIHY